MRTTNEISERLPVLSLLISHRRSPRYVAAPMVNQSELPYRLLMRRYGAQLCYTPMLNSKAFVKSEAYRISTFSTCSACVNLPTSSSPCSLLP